MIKAALREIAEVAGAVSTAGEFGSHPATGVSIDSRTTVEGNLFIAIQGPTHDAHRFIDNALDAGASGVIAREGFRYEGQHPDAKIIFVPDTFKAMHDLAKWWLDKFDIMKLAVTGTNGKTTTKEMIAAVLSRKFTTYRSPGNFNNLYGIPLAIFGLDSTVESAVFEFGMSTPGEIETLTRMFKPEYGLITNIDAAHLETMKSIDAIAKAKFELFDNMPDDGTVFLNLDNAWLKKRYETENRHKVGFGIENHDGLHPVDFGSNGSGCFKFVVEQIGDIHLHIPGIHNLYNAVAACAVGHELGVEPGEIKSALEDFSAIGMRMEIIELRGVKIINDAYNSNPASLRNALKTLVALDVSGKKIAVLGDMLELGKREGELHREVGEFIASLDVDMLLLSGKLARDILSGAESAGFDTGKVEYFASMDDLTEHLLELVVAGDAVLIKASRSMAFDKIVTALTSSLGRER